MLTDQQIDEFLDLLAKSPTSARDMVRGLFAAHEAKAAPAVPQGGFGIGAHALAEEVIVLLGLIEDDLDSLQIQDGQMPVSATQWGKVARMADLARTAPAQEPMPQLAALSAWKLISEDGDGQPNHGDIVLCEMAEGQARHTINFGFEVVQWDENFPIDGVVRWILLNRLPETQADFLLIDRLESAPAQEVGLTDEVFHQCVLACGFTFDPRTGHVWVVDGGIGTSVTEKLRKFATELLSIAALREKESGK